MYRGIGVSAGVLRMRHYKLNLVQSSPGSVSRETHIDIPSSLMIYPIPYPSAATGPKPNSLNAGLPQFEVDKIDVDRSAQPGSVKISGILFTAVC